jgi:hypothetical protein
MRVDVIRVALAVCVTVIRLFGITSDAVGQRGEYQNESILGMHKRVLDGWLRTQPNLRRAALADCTYDWIDSKGVRHRESCARSIADLRMWTSNPHTNPYYTEGDFNHDGGGDFAVVLLDKRKKTDAKDRALIAVFNGPFSANRHEPIFLLRGRSLPNLGSVLALLDPNHGI